MKFWSSEHIFNHPWETIAQAAFRKYPNPINTAVIGIDVIDRKVSNGILQSHRLVSSIWVFPKWAQALIGHASICYASERSEVDPNNRQLVLKTRNLTFGNYIVVDEILKYTPHPTDANKTLLVQETELRVKGIPFTHYMEELLASKISSTAEMGPEGMEWAINSLGLNGKNQLNNSSSTGNDLLTQTRRQIDDLTSKTRKSMDDLQSAAKKSFDEIHNLTSPPNSQSMPKL